MTIILPRSPALPDIVTAGGRTVAVRCPDHPVPVALMNELGSPMAATSANLSGRPSPATADQVLDQLEGRLPLIIDGGSCPIGIPSTLLDLSSSPPRLLRAGAIPMSDLLRVLPDLTE